jgi:DNA-binding NarL/FixJ family response regulator
MTAGESRGEASLVEALREFEALGASWDAGRVRAELRTHGVCVPSPWRAGRRGYGDELTPRESEIARLVASGSTNREIAGLLYISPRTVENHVASILRKLELTSRNEIAQHIGEEAINE